MKNYEKCKKSGLRVWQMNEAEFWIGFELGEIKDKMLSLDKTCEITVFGEIPLERWNSKFVIESDERYQPRYTWIDYIAKMIDEYVDFPCMLATTEY